MENKTKNKKIEVVTKYFYPVTAGIETNIMQVYSNLVSFGWDVTVHTTNRDYSTKKLTVTRETINGIKIIRYPLWKFYLWPGLNLNRSEVICLHNFNIVPHFTVLVASVILKIIGRKNYSLFLIPHGGFTPEWRLFSPLVRFLKSKYHYGLGVDLINRSVDGVRAVAGWEGSEMIKNGIRPELVKVISNGIEKEAYLDIDKLASPEIKKKVKKLGRYIIQVGRVHPIKDQETAIRALNLLTDKDLKLVLVGPNEGDEYKISLDRIIKKLKLKDRVLFLGVIRGVDKYYLIKHSVAMVHMAIWEGNANVINEAWSQGTLCIVADSLGLNEQIRNGENGYLVPQKDYKTLSRVLTRVLKSPDSKTIEKMKLVNKKYALENSWSDVARKVGSLYSKDQNEPILPDGKTKTSLIRTLNI